MYRPRLPTPFAKPVRALPTRRTGIEEASTAAATSTAPTRPTARPRRSPARRPIRSIRPEINAAALAVPIVADAVGTPPSVASPWISAATSVPTVTAAM
jgi:hypothetical protein